MTIRPRARALACVALLAAGCSSHSTGAPSATEVIDPTVPQVPPPCQACTKGPIATTELAGVCPSQGDAEACPELGGAPAWVGCTRITASMNTDGFVSCTCFATETGEGAWACKVADAGPELPEASGPMTSPEVAEASVDAADAAPSDAAAPNEDGGLDSGDAGEP